MLFLLILVCFFLFKQKTAYEMRISDWSSDVCSSDLRQLIAGRHLCELPQQVPTPVRDGARLLRSFKVIRRRGQRALTELVEQPLQVRAAEADRKSVV